MTLKPKPIDVSTLDILRRFYRTNRRLPTYTEMARLFQYNSKHAAFRLAKKLIAEGYIEKDTSGRLIPKSNHFGIPLVGYVQAGFPSPAEEELIGTFSLDDYLIDKPGASFLLKVSGDSMNEAGILEGDVVIVERGRSPKNGDIILAHVDDAWTLKYYRKHGKDIELVPANQKYPILRPKRELRLEGIVRGAFRKY